jgi:hypothetical protein
VIRELAQQTGRMALRAVRGCRPLLKPVRYCLEVILQSRTERAICQYGFANDVGGLHGKAKAEAVPVTRFEQLNLKTQLCVRNVCCCEVCGCEFDASVFFRKADVKLRRRLVKRWHQCPQL